MEEKESAILPMPTNQLCTWKHLPMGQFPRKTQTPEGRPMITRQTSTLAGSKNQGTLRQEIHFCF
jgi:hypothetical protein